MKKETQIQLREFITMVREMTEDELRVLVLDCQSAMTGKELDLLNKMISAIKEAR